MSNVIPVIYPNNPFVVVVTLTYIDDTTFEEVPYMTGVVTGFLATARTNAAVAADATLQANLTHRGNGGWVFYLTAGAMTYALLNGLFAAVTPYLITVRANGVRAYAELAYLPERPAVVT